MENRILGFFSVFHGDYFTPLVIISGFSLQNNVYICKKKTLAQSKPLKKMFNYQNTNIIFDEYKKKCVLLKTF